MKHFLILFSALFLITLLSQSCEDVIGLDKKIWKRKVDTVKKDTIVKDDTLKYDSSHSSKLEFEPKEIDFGRTSLGDLKELYYCITNTSDEKFLITSVKCENPAFNVWAGNLPVSVPPGGKYCMVISFEPDKQGDHYGIIIINDDPQYFLIARGQVL